MSELENSIESKNSDDSLKSMLFIRGIQMELFESFEVADEFLIGESYTLPDAINLNSKLNLTHRKFYEVINTNGEYVGSIYNLGGKWFYTCVKTLLQEYQNYYYGLYSDAKLANKYKNVKCDGPSIWIKPTENNQGYHMPKYLYNVDHNDIIDTYGNFLKADYEVDNGLLNKVVDLLNSRDIHYSHMDKLFANLEKRRSYVKQKEDRKNQQEIIESDSKEFAQNELDFVNNSQDPRIDFGLLDGYEINEYYIDTNHTEIVLHKDNKIVVGIVVDKSTQEVYFADYINKEVYVNRGGASGEKKNERNFRNHGNVGSINLYNDTFRSQFAKYIKKKLIPKDLIRAFYFKEKQTIIRILEST